jgi:hypothetical protein
VETHQSTVWLKARYTSYPTDWRSQVQFLYPARCLPEPNNQTLYEARLVLNQVVPVALAVLRESQFWFVAVPMRETGNVPRRISQRNSGTHCESGR